MRRDLPPRPHIDHLKKQAKELLDAHQRGEPEALDRISGALPALAGRSRDEVARTAFALHDAQSTIAREYGFRSWRELRAAVMSQSEPTTPAEIDVNVRALLEQFKRFSQIPLPEAVLGLISQLSSAKPRQLVAEALRAGIPERLPLLAVRNALVLRTAIAPLHVARPMSLAAIEAACRATPSTVAVFAQRSESDDTIGPETLHPIGCQALVHASHPHGEGQIFVVIEALRPIVLRAIEPPTSAGAALFAHTSAFALDFEDAADELPALDRTLRTYAKQLAGLLPEPERAVAQLDGLDEVDLADAVMMNLPCAVADKAQYAAEPRLVERVRIAIQLVERTMQEAR